MSRDPAKLNNIKAPRPSLRSVLNRGHLKVALTAVNLAGLLLTLLGVLALRVYADHNQHLIARSISYTVEAAVVFDDKLAASEALSMIASTEEVAQAQVVNAKGELMAHWALPSDGLLTHLELLVAHVLMTKPVELPISHQGQVIGSVSVSGNGRSLFKFLISGLGGILGCLALTAMATQHMSRRLLRGIIRPLHNLATTAHAARVDRAFDRRVPEADIAELNDLGNDFNALLGELGEWHANVTHEYRQLEHQASHDSLTGLPNRAFFEGRLNRAVSNAEMFNEQVAVLFLDSDRFKSINDTHGHAAGDAVLVSVAARVKAQLREHDLVARLGGDEFAVLLSPIQGTDDALRIVDGIIASMDVPIEIPGGTTVITSLSIGMSVFPAHATTSHQLLVAADAAMYEAKRAGRGSRRIALPVQDDIKISTGAKR